MKKVWILPLVILLGMVFGMKAHAAWDLVRAYQSDTLYGTVNGKLWSPYSGSFYGDLVKPTSGNRYITLRADNVAWNGSATNWIRLNTSGYVSITFHSFEWATDGCSNFKSTTTWMSNLPSARLVRVIRQCYTSYTESRIEATNRSALLQGYIY